MMPVIYRKRVIVVAGHSSVSSWDTILASTGQSRGSCPPDVTVTVDTQITVLTFIFQLELPYGVRSNVSRNLC